MNIINSAKRSFSVVILIVVVLSGVDRGYAQQSKVKSLGGGRYLTESVHFLPVSGLNRLRVTGPRNLSGQIIVMSRAVDSAYIEIAKILKVETAEAAMLFDREIRVRIEPVDGALQLAFVTRSGAPWEGTESSARCDATVVIPRKWDIAVDVHHFDCDLQGPFRDVSVSTEFGRVKVQDVSERVDVSGKFTTVELKDVRGLIDSETSHALLKVTNAIASPERAARFINTSGPIEIDQLAGALIAESDGAPVTLNDIVLVGSTSRIRCDNAPVTMRIAEFSDARLGISNDNSSVVLSVPHELSARFNLSVGLGGTIKTSGVEIQTHRDLLGRGHLEGVAGAGGGIIDVGVSGTGRIIVTGT